MRCKRSQAYQASVLEARETLAAILGMLGESGRLENTVVVLYSDHGEAFQERREQHRELQTDPRGMYGTGHGQYQFQELLHVPLLAWVPGLAGTSHSRQVSLVDLFPSMLHWLGADQPAHDLPGQLLPGPSTAAAKPRAIYASNIAYGPETVAILSGQHKAMYWPDRDRFLFFDLARDPDERSPLEDDGLMLEFSTLAGDYLALPRQYSAAAPAPGQLEDLQAIGYLQGVEDEPEQTTDDEAPEDKDTP
jgi:arylsulfatase A-like enzyme